MSISYPTTLDVFTNPTATSKRDTPSLSSQQSDQNDAIEALEAKVGVTGSAVASTLDYKVTSTSSSNPGHKHTLAQGATDVTATSTELNYSSGVTSALQTQINAKMASSATVFNKVTITAPATASTLTVANGKTLTASDTTTLATNAITLAGGEVITFSASNAFSLLTTGSTVMTFPAVTDTVAVLGTAQTFTATQTEKQIVYTNNAITATGNAATVPITHRLHTVTNNSAATLTITMTTTSAVDGQLSMVRILDASAVAQTITWVNTENSTISAPITSNGSTTLFLTAGFIYNSATSKWRCIASA